MHRITPRTECRRIVRACSIGFLNCVGYASPLNVRPVKGKDSMHWQGRLALLSAAAIFCMTNQSVRAQGIGKYFAPPDQIIAIRAGRLFDSRAGSIQNNQIVLIAGDRITDVGTAVQIPANARVLDLSSARPVPFTCGSRTAHSSTAPH
jgi:hypothetical protein